VYLSFAFTEANTNRSDPRCCTKCLQRKPHAHHKHVMQAGEAPAAGGTCLAGEGCAAGSASASAGGCSGAVAALLARSLARRPAAAAATLAGTASVLGAAFIGDGAAEGAAGGPFTDDAAGDGAADPVSPAVRRRGCRREARGCMPAAAAPGGPSANEAAAPPPPTPFCRLEAVGRMLGRLGEAGRAARPAAGAGGGFCGVPGRDLTGEAPRDFCGEPVRNDGVRLRGPVPAARPPCSAEASSTLRASFRVRIATDSAASGADSCALHNNVSVAFW